jgi:hypothetical protein
MESSVAVVSKRAMLLQQMQFRFYWRRARIPNVRYSAD